MYNQQGILICTRICQSDYHSVFPASLMPNSLNILNSKRSDSVFPEGSISQQHILV